MSTTAAREPWVHRHAYPLTLFGGTALAGLLSTWLPPLLAIAPPILLGLAVIAWLERRHPLGGEGWRPSAATVRADLVHTALTGLFPTLLKTLTFGAVYYAASTLSAWWGSGLWPSGWPLAAQVALALVIGEFGAYALHRVCHLRDWMWRIHALHHSTARLYVLASGRNHPFNAIGTSMLTLLPLVLLGAGEDVLLLHTVFTALTGFWQHADFRTRSGWWNYLLASPELHRWHHSRVFEEGQHNFGNNLIVWDLVFGTWYLPADREPPAETGLDEMDFTTNVWAHLASPLRWRPLLREPEPVEVG